MKDYIQQYILLNKNVSIKGWGTLKIVSISAQLDFANRLLYAPSYTFEFIIDCNDDPLFLHWLSKQLNISTETCIQKLNLFAVDFKQSLDVLKKINWTGYGFFEQNKDGGLTFIADHSNKNLLHPISVERILRKGAEHSIRVGEDERTNLEMEEILHAEVKKKKPLWLLNALLLLSIGIIFALYFATNYNILWNKHSNSQLIQPKDPPLLYKKH